ncbi:MAG: CDP-glycerol glycerophosphotransferase family protein, partial [Clostridia bacterium]|nr:CDP-glycerol glycerophosphotransferase family protein [Clostridia bacterium]
QHILTEIDDELFDRVLSGSAPEDYSERVFLLGVKHRRFEPVKLSVLGDQLLLTVEDKPFASHLQTPVSIQAMEAADGALEIDGTIANVYGDHAVLQARVGGQTVQPTYCERYALTRYFGRSAFKQRAFHIRLPLTRDAVQSFGFELVFEGRAYPLPLRFDSHFSRLTNILPHATWRFGDRVARYHAPTGSVILRQNRPLAQVGRELGVWWDLLRTRDKRAYAMLLMRAGYWIAHPFLRRRHIWFFMDKIYKGGDNAEYLYRYAAGQKDGITARYLIDRHVPDAVRLRRDGLHPLYRGTFAHYMNLLHAEMLIASNSTVLELNHISPATSAYIRDLIGFHVVCVQHGLSVQRIAAAQNRLRDNTRLYFCASQVEIENLSRPIYDYVGYDALRLTGVPRFDGLQNRAKKQILLAPTWRMHAAVTVRKNEGVQRDYNPLFKETPYFKVYNDLIHHPRLLTAAKEFGFTIAYVLHPIVSPQARDYEAEPPVTVIPATGDMSYETLFCESALMVTDYSGVQFDFAYMRKPIMYFLPEELPKHYEEGAFSTETMGFGELCRDTESLVDALIDAMKSGCPMSEKYKARADRFFAFNDHDNCKRIYEELMKYRKKHFG